jgi:hypothetical protein
MIKAFFLLTLTNLSAAVWLLYYGTADSAIAVARYLAQKNQKID